MRALVALLVACGGKVPPPSAPLDNKATASTGTVSDGCRPHGVVLDASIGEPAIGATVVFSGAPHEQVTISNEKGRFSLEVDVSHNRLTLYYNDRTFEWAFVPSYCRTRIRITLDPPNAPQTPIIPY